MVGYRLVPTASDRLDAVARELNRSKTAIIEQLIAEYLPQLVDGEARRVAEVAAKYGEKNPPGK